MTTMAPIAARALWLALLDNAARIVVEADALFPSPRAQSLVVLAQEEVGKAIWVRNAFWDAWYGDDETSREVPELHSQWRAHSAKLMAATDYYTAALEVPGGTQPVDIEVVKAHAPELVVAYLKQTALEDNQAKQKGFYVDLKEDGTFTVPHEVDRPLLRTEIWAAADMIKWSLDDDHMLCSVVRRPRTSSDSIATKLDSVLAHDPEEWTEARD
ncbi:AbiV family abortive infection protein [Citricoccus sp. GCM10030269]|uniref:AbiV family abortive infection protein n=1 Tax=Citricoccus sp. GCM10030269 TaxID=3273388 RepID=UPI003618B41E